MERELEVLYPGYLNLARCQLDLPIQMMERELEVLYLATEL